MSQIKQLLRLHKQGDSIKSIARNLGISKNTVKAYISKLAAGEIPVSELLEMEDPLLKGKFHVGSPAYSYPQFCFHLRQQLVARRPGMRLEQMDACQST